MGEPEDLEVGEVGGEEPAAEEEVSQGFSIGLVIEWLLKNMIPIIVAVVVSLVIMFIYVRASIANVSEEKYVTVRLKPKPKPLGIFNLDDFKVNTADLDEPHFIRIKLNIGYDLNNKKLQTELSERKVQMRDIILGILNSKEKTDIDEEKEKERLKEEIKKAINNALIGGEIEAVYYDEFVIS